MVSKKAAAKIVDFYYFHDKELTCRDLLAAVGDYNPKSDIWTEINLMEVVLANDSLIFQDASDCFEAEEDLRWLEEHQIKTKYEVSFDTRDLSEVKLVMKNIMTALGGMFCSDTEDFEPIFTGETIDAVTI